LTLTASIDAQTISATVNLDIRDPCETATIITTPSILSTMNIVTPSVETTTQSYAITTDVT